MSTKSKPKTLRKKLLEDAEAFCAKEGISLARFGGIVMNHGGFFKRIEDGGDCKTSVYERIQKIIADPKEWETAKAAARKRGTKEQAEPA